MILHTNDVHCSYDAGIGYDGLKLYREELEQQYEHVLLADAGDALQGRQIGPLSKGQELIRIMNRLHYDVAIPGNHEFDYGDDGFRECAELLDCGYICSNFCTSNGTPVLEPYRIFDFDQCRIGFLGVDTPDTLLSSIISVCTDETGEPKYSFLMDDSGETLYRTLQGYIDELKEQNCDYIILLAHLGNGDAVSPRYESKTIISHLSGLDAVIDAHSHEAKIETVKDQDGKELLLTQAGVHFSHVGKLIIHTDGTITAELIDEVPKPEGIAAIEVTREDGKRWVDPQEHELLRELTAVYEARSNEVIGETEFDLLAEDKVDGLTAAAEELALGDLAVDAFRSFTGADIAFIPMASIYGVLRSGEITRNDEFKVFPYINPLVTFHMKGSEILELLEYTVRELPELSYLFPNVSGLRFTVDLSQPEGNRGKDVLVNDVPLDPEADYSFTTSMYIKNGNYGFTILEKYPIETLTEENESDVLLEYILTTLNGIIPEEYQIPQGQITILQ
ncbi:MAG: bifunctional metallophosphatase/5'-nucleotidase [Solobacterium sp.]|nr:bifunctional metallophosphatase/5'-nucleotidase [Solobacterium sp.]